MKKKISLIFIFVALYGWIISTAEASYIPSGLNPGDHYQLIFVTSTARDATSSNISDYNAFVNTAAKHSGSLVSNVLFYAIASTGTVNAKDNAAQSINPKFVGVFNLNGSLVANNIYSGSLNNAINYDETGTLHGPSPWVWTGSDKNGIAVVNKYMSAPTVTYGLSNNASYSLYYVNRTHLSTSSQSLYALSEDLVVPSSVPEPSTYLLLCIGLSVLAYARKRMNKQATL